MSRLARPARAWRCGCAADQLRHDDKAGRAGRAHQDRQSRRRPSGSGTPASAARRRSCGWGWRRASTASASTAPATRAIVVALELASGKRLWRRQLKAPLSGGPGAGDGLVVVGSSKGDVIALSRSRRHAALAARSQLRDSVGPGRRRVTWCMRAQRRRPLYGLASADGSERWVVDQQVPRLSLRGDQPPDARGRTGDVRLRQRPRRWRSSAAAARRPGISPSDSRTAAASCSD